MNSKQKRLPRTIIRVGRQSLYFVMPAADGSGEVAVHPYTVKSGMSMAANLRAAFRDIPSLTASSNRAQVVVDAPVALIPMEEYDEADAEQLFFHTFPNNRHEAVMTNVVPDLNCVAAFSVNKDLRVVVTDHFDDVRFLPVVIPVCRHLHQHSHVGHSRKLYAYQHDSQLTIASYATNRFRFMNTYNATEVQDAAYFVLYVWQQLGMSNQKDEIYIMGDARNIAELKGELQKYVSNVYSISPSAEFNRAPVTRHPNITYDIICLCES